jgi:uncharacterized protein with GYD domain
MSQARTEPRAAERRAVKLARKAAQKPNPAAVSTTPVATYDAVPEEFNYATAHAAATPEPEPAFKTANSEAKLAANRANAQKSTGPRTDAAKAVTRFNAVRNALTGQTILLPTDDALLYQNHCHAYRKELNPVGAFETNLVQAIADHDWRLARSPALEANLYALGERNLAGDEMPAHLLEAHIQVTYEKHFRNLHLQQNRLTRYRAKDLAELKALQQARFEEEKQSYERAAVLEKQAEATGQPFQPEKFGFVFSAADLAAFREAKSDLGLAKLLIQLRSKGQKTLAEAA